MFFSVQRRPVVRLFAWGPAFFLLLFTGGCYTRQIEGIQSDLDNLDRKIHSFNTKKTGGNVSDSGGAVKNFEDELNRVRMQQANLKDDLTQMQQQLVEAQEEAKFLGAGPSGSGSVPPGELGAIRKEIVKNQEQTDRLSKEMEDLQKTFGTLKSETRALIDLLQTEYGSETSATGDSVSSAPPPASTQVEQPGQPVSEARSDVKAARTHWVTPGETLSSIARKYEVSMETLKELNRIEDPNNLLLNQEVYIP